MDVLFKLVVLAALLTAAESYCYTQIRTAYPSSNTYSVNYPSSNQYCTIYIQPVWYYRSYYLEISWSSSHFDVKGDMPDCKDNNIEVYLTRNYKSIGKYCSNNAQKPFTMYSRDGYARIDYRTSGYETGRGFMFTYKLKSKTSDYLGNSAWAATCYNTQNYASSGVIYSSGWPYQYAQSSSSCSYKIYKSSFARGIRVVFMDVDVYSYRYYDDCVRLFASNYSSDYFFSSVSPRLCSRNYTGTFTTYGKYLKITFDRYSRMSSYRGFVAGYISFTSSSHSQTTQAPLTTTQQVSFTTPPFRYPANKSASSRLSSVTIGIILGTVIPSIVVVIVIIIAIIFCKQRNRRNSAPTSFTETRSNGMLATTQHTGTQQVVQGGSCTSYTNSGFSTPQHMYPASTMQIGSSPADPCSLSNPTALAHSTAQLNRQGSAPAQFTFLVAPSHNFIPAGALIPANDQRQPPNASLPYPTISSSSYNYNPNTTAPFNTSRSEPPPPYSSVMRQ